MFSKEWKVLAVSALAVTSLTACPGNKKKSKEATTQFQGSWVNIEAKERLLGVGILVGPRAQEFCMGIQNHPRRLGISRHKHTGKLQLNAFLIRPNGDVFRYTPYPNAPGQPPRRLGRINGFNYNGDSGTGVGSFNAAADAYGTPFAGANALLRLDNANGLMSVAGSSGYGYGATEEVVYTRATEAELADMSSVVASCHRYLNFGDGWSGDDRDDRGPGRGGHFVPLQAAPGGIPVPPPVQCAPGQPCGPEVPPAQGPGQGFTK